MSILPVVGAALTSPHLPQHLDWILAGQRDLEIQDITDPELLDGDWQARAHAISAMLQGHTGRRGIHGPFYGIDIGCKDRAIQAVVQQRLLQGLEFAQIVGASHMVVHSPFMAFGSPFSAIQPKTLASTIQIANHIMAPVVAKAAEIGCLLVIETIQDQQPQHLRSLITSFNSPWVRHSIDVGHVRITMTRGGASVPEWIRQNGDLLEHVHLQDNDGSYDAHLGLGQGDINFTSIFATLQGFAHRPRLILELNNHHDIPQSWQYLKNLGLVV